MDRFVYSLMVSFSAMMLTACDVHGFMGSFDVVLSNRLVMRVDDVGDGGVLHHLMRHMLVFDMMRLRCLVVHWHFVVLNLLIHVMRHSVVHRFVSFEYHLWLMVNWVSPMYEREWTEVFYPCFEELHLQWRRRGRGDNI